MTVVGDFIELSYGKALKAEHRSGGNVPVVGSGGIVGGHSEGLTTTPTIVVGRKGSIGSVTWVDGPAWPIDTAYYVKPKRADLNLRWTYWMLKSRQLETMNKSAAVPGLNRDDVYRLMVDVPAPPDQQRIAAILDRADEIRSKRRQVLADLESLTQSMFTESFGHITQRARLRDLGVDFVSGKNVLGGDLDAHASNRVIKVSAISRGTFVPSESKPMPIAYTPPIAHRLRKGDILFGRASGSLELLGATAVVDVDTTDLFLPDKVWRLTTRSGGPCDASYVMAVLRSADARSFIKHNASGAAGVRNIGKARLLEYRAPVAPLELQREFAARIAGVNAQRAHVTRALAADNELFASLQSRAFRGEL